MYIPIPIPTSLFTLHPTPQPSNPQTPYLPTLIYPRIPTDTPSFSSVPSVSHSKIPIRSIAFVENLNLYHAARLRLAQNPALYATPLAFPTGRTASAARCHATIWLTGLSESLNRDPG